VIWYKKNQCACDIIQKKSMCFNILKQWYRRVTDLYVVPIKIVVRNRVTSCFSIWNTPSPVSFSANSRTWIEIP
jgi:hypothetical protein